MQRGRGRRGGEENKKGGGGGGGVGYVGIFEGIWPNTVLFLLPHSVAVSLPCLL